MSLTLHGCDEFKYVFADTPLYEWNQKYTLVLETPVGERNYSGIIKFYFQDNTKKPAFGSGAAYAFDAHGEAIVAKLPSGQYLFGLILQRYYDAFSVFSNKERSSANNYENLAPRIIDYRGPAKKLRPENYPRLIVFEDISNPLSVKYVDPDDLAATLGEGYRLKSISLQITDEPMVTGRINKILKWINDVEGGHINGERLGGPDDLLERDFRRGDFR